MKNRLRLCRGKDCRKHGKGLRKLADEVDDLTVTDQVKCQDICKGAVVVVHAQDHKYWMKKMGGKQQRQRLRMFLESGEIPDQLEKHIVKRKRRRR
mgnify:CR=1 FL=1